MRELELYIHIPFCVKKCAYCDFLSAPADRKTRSAYMNRLSEEIRAKAFDHSGYRISSIYIGGGTPSILEASQITRLMDQICAQFNVLPDAEISIECNPGTLTRDKARALRDSGINRLSLGLQSSSDTELALLGRIHTYEDFLSSFDAARKSGFSNINVDLMSSLPGQTAADWEVTLKRVSALRPEHISAYSLIIEEGTPFYDRYIDDELERERGGIPQFLPTEEEDRRMYAITDEILGSRGYNRYEISNYARPGFECRHNIGYWTGREYLGLGLGAASLTDNVRFKNTDVLKDYLEGPFTRCDEAERTRKEEIEEFMFLGLRMTHGISRREFESRFGTTLESVYGNTLRDLEEKGLLCAEEGRLYLTSAGVDLSNFVLSYFLL